MFHRIANLVQLTIPAFLLLSVPALADYESGLAAFERGDFATALAEFSVAVTGIAGPDGGTPDKPVGTVHIAVAHRGHDTAHAGHHYPGDRAQIRVASVEAALDMLLRATA